MRIEELILSLRMYALADRKLMRARSMSLPNRDKTSLTNGWSETVIASTLEQLSAELTTK